jgi:hypothetical protein
MPTGHRDWKKSLLKLTSENLSRKFWRPYLLGKTIVNYAERTPGEITGELTKDDISANMLSFIFDMLEMWCT